MRQEILKSATKMFIQKGYAGTTLRELAASCGLKKSSLFHHFLSKEAIALETINIVHKYCKDNIFKYVHMESLTNREKQHSFLVQAHKFFLLENDSSLVSLLGVSMVDIYKIFNDPIRNYINDWIQSILTLIVSGNNKDNTNDIIMANSIVAEIHGALLLKRIYPSTLSLTYSLIHLTNIINLKKTGDN